MMSFDMHMRKGNGLCGEIENDGRGYSPDSQAGLGLRSMRSRAGQLGGALEIGARPQGGARVTLRFRLTRKSLKRTNMRLC